MSGLNLLFKIFRPLTVWILTLSLVFPFPVFATGTGTPPTSLPSGLPSQLPSGVPSGIPTATPSFDPNIAKTVGDCQRACTAYKTVSAEDELTNACGTPPPESARNIKVENNGRTFANYDSCKTAIYGENDNFSKASRWGVLGQHCDAIDLYQTGVQQDLMTGVVFAAATGVCSFACLAGYIPFLAAAAKAAELACTVADLGTMAVDIAGEVTISKKGEEHSAEWDDWWQRKTGYASDSLGLAGAGLGLAGQGASLYAKGIAKGVAKGAAKGGAQTSNSTFQIAGKAGAETAAEAIKESLKIAQKEGLDAAAELTKATKLADDAEAAVKAAKQAQKDAMRLIPPDLDAIEDAQKALDKAEDTLKNAKTAVTKATNKATDAASKVDNLAAKAGKANKASNAQKALVCMSAVMLAAATALKWANYATNQDRANNECSTVKAMEGIGTAHILRPGSTSEGKGFSPAQAAFTNALKAGGGDTTGNATDYTKNINNSSPTFPQGAVQPLSRSAAAMGFINSMPNKDMIPAALEKMGTNLEDLTKRLTTSPPGEVLAAIAPDLPQSYLNTLKEIDQLALSGKLKIEGDEPAAVYAGAGSSAAKAGEDPYAFMRKGSAGGAAGGTAAKEVGFEKSAKKDQTLPADGDIWHGSWGGSIFQIVTIRLNGTRDRIDNLEWSTPLNRALNGLAPMSPHAPPKPVGIPTPGVHR